MKKISDEQFRAYFLGRLPEAEAEILETQCAVDADLTEQAQTVERELADDYLREALSAADARSFEKNYLTTEARHAKVRIAANLWQIAREEKPKSAAAAEVASAAVATNSIWQKILSGNNLKLVFGAFALLFVCAAIVFYLSKTSVENQQVAKVDIPNPTAEPENPAIENPAPENPTAINSAPTENSAVSSREANRNTNSAQKNQPAPKTATAPKVNGRNQPNPAIFALLPGTLRDAGEQFITVTPSAKNLGVRLKLPEDAGKYQIYRADVKTAEGDSVFTAANLNSANFTIPAANLENRTYIIFLEGKNSAGEFEPVAEYSVRVRR